MPDSMWDPAQQRLDNAVIDGRKVRATPLHQLLSSVHGAGGPLAQQALLSERALP